MPIYLNTGNFTDTAEILAYQILSAYDPASYPPLQAGQEAVPPFNDTLEDLLYLILGKVGETASGGTPGLPLGSLQFNDGGQLGGTPILYDPVENNLYYQGTGLVPNVGGSIGLGLNGILSGFQNALFGGLRNRVSGGQSGVFAGTDNHATDAFQSVIVGGSDNRLNPFANQSAILAGDDNQLLGNQNFIAGGFLNQLRRHPTLLSSPGQSGIAGGAQNVIEGSQQSFVGGGSGNRITGNSLNAILGGSNATISGFTGSVILGGNLITADASDTVFVPRLHINTPPAQDNSLADVLVWNPLSRKVQRRDAASLTGGTPVLPGGSNRQIQFNDNGVFGGAPQFDYTAQGGLQLGAGAVASAIWAVAFGADSDANFPNAIALGELNQAAGLNTAVLGGRNNRATGQRSVTIGGENLLSNTADDTVMVPYLCLGDNAAYEPFEDFAQTGKMLVRDPSGLVMQRNAPASGPVEPGGQTLAVQFKSATGEFGGGRLSYAPTSNNLFFDDASLSGSPASVAALSESAFVSGTRSGSLGGFGHQVSGIDSGLLGGFGNSLGGRSRSVILGGQNITATEDDTAYVPALEVAVAGAGAVLRSPDGTRYRLSVDNTGVLQVAAA